MRHITYANVVATLALLLAVGGGSAYAASKLITGKQIAKHSITAANIKNKSLTSAVFSKSALTAGPRGATGATGATGAQGPAGPAGATGAAGSALAYGEITTNGAGNPTFVPGTVGFTSVYSPSSGVLCLAAPAGTSANNQIIQVQDAGGTTDQWEAFTNAQCGGSGFEIGNATGPDALTAQLTVAIP